VKHEYKRSPGKADPLYHLPYDEILIHGLYEGSSTGTRLSGLKGTFSGTLHAAERLLYGDSVRLKGFTTDPQSTRVRWALLGVLVVAVGVGVTWVLGALAGWGLLGIAVILIGGGMIVANRWMPRRTGLGTDLFRKTLGFRLYMTRAEKDRQAFAEKAEIFTQYLPYAIVFGCVHRWAKAFEGIDTSVAVSTWYQGPGPFYPAIFARNLEGFSHTLSPSIAKTLAGSGG